MGERADVSENKIISMKSRKELEWKKTKQGFEESLERIKEKMFEEMEELHKVCISAGKPKLFCSFLSDLSTIATIWSCIDDKEEELRKEKKRR